MTPDDAPQTLAPPARAAETLTDRIEADARLDGLAAGLGRAADAVVPPGPRRDGLRGGWVGHPLHPMLVDLPIGFWTSAFVVDLVGGARGRPAADRLVAAGIVSAVPAVVAGLAELTALRDDAARRVAAVHAVGNGVGTALYVMSWRNRRRGRRLRGVALSWAGAAAMSVSGHLGGHLAFRLAAGVDTSDHPPAASPG